MPGIDLPVAIISAISSNVIGYGGLSDGRDGARVAESGDSSIVFKGTAITSEGTACSEEWVDNLKMHSG